MKYTTTEIKRKLAAINPNLRILNKYTGYANPLLCLCLKCKHTWDTIWTRLQVGYGCPKCARAIIEASRRLSLDCMKSKLRLINPRINILSTDGYTNTLSRIKCSCSICKTEWFPSWKRLQAGEGCPKCGVQKAAIANRFTQQEVVDKLQLISPSIKILGKYKNSVTPLKCRCLACTHTWAPTWLTLSQGRGCPKCSSGKSEEYVRGLLEKLTNLKWPRATPTEVPFLHGLHLDGYCSDLKSVQYPNGTAFERQGEQHYQLVHFGGRADTKARLLRRKRNDWRKRYQCWYHGVRLIRIPHWIKNIESYLCKKLNLQFNSTLADSLNQ